MSVLDATISGPLAWGAAIAGLFLIAGTFLTVYRLVIGPTLPDRVVALDLLAMLLTALLVLFAMAVDVASYLDAALVLALVSFLSTVAFARYIERRDQDAQGRETPQEIEDLAAAAREGATASTAEVRDA